MATVRFRIRSSANKNVAIKVRIAFGRGNDIEINTGFSINPKDWSEKTNFPKQTIAENKLLSANLKKLETFILESHNKDLSNPVLINSYWLECKINECFKRVVRTDSGIITNHLNYIVENANTRKVKTQGGFKIGLSESTIKNYNQFKNIIGEYQAKTKKQIRFDDLGKPFVDKFTSWLINEKKYSTNYAGKQLEILKTVSIDAERNEISVNPYSKIIQHFRESDNDRYIQTLDFEELDRIKNLDITDHDKLSEFKKQNPELTKNLSITTDILNNARNWILLGCEIGQRGGDLLEITSENVRFKGNNIYLDVMQQKTKKSVTVGIIAPHVIDILESGTPKKIPHQKLNEYTKVICKLAGIDQVVKGTKLNVETNRKELGHYPKYELIASHCFRRSFATNYYKKVPTAILINITGHSKESLFLTYINKREDKDSNADLFMQFYQTIHQEKASKLKVV